MAKKSDFKTYFTPDGIAKMAFLNKPSTKFNADGVYSVKMVFDPEAFQPHIETLEKIIEQKFEDTLKEKPKLKKVLKKKPIFVEETDDEGDPTGKIEVNFKRDAKTKLKDGTVKTNKVKLIDTSGKVTTVSIWGGSTLAIEYFVTPYFSEKDKEVGVSLKLKTVMIVDLVSGGADDGDIDLAKTGFGKRDGGFKAVAGKAEDTDEDDEDNDDDAADDAGDDADF